MKLIILDRRGVFGMVGCDFWHIERKIGCLPDFTFPLLMEMG